MISELLQTFISQDIFKYVLSEYIKDLEYIMIEKEAKKFNQGL